MANPPVLRGLLVLLACQVLGELAVRVSGISFPGPVIGMVLFFLILLRRQPEESDGLVEAPAFLLRHLQLLFVPVGVGVIAHLDRIRTDGLALASGLVVSWLVGFVVTAGVVATLLRWQQRRAEVKER